MLQHGWTPINNQLEHIFWEMCSARWLDPNQQPFRLHFVGREAIQHASHIQPNTWFFHCVFLKLYVLSRAGHLALKHDVGHPLSHQPTLNFQNVIRQRVLELCLVPVVPPGVEVVSARLLVWDLSKVAHSIIHTELHILGCCLRLLSNLGTQLHINVCSNNVF